MRNNPIVVVSVIMMLPVLACGFAVDLGLDKLGLAPTGPSYDTVDVASSNGELRATITYPTQMMVGDYADIAVAIENRGTVDWKGGQRDVIWAAEVSLWSDAALGTDYYFRALPIAETVPADCHHYTDGEIQLEALLQADGEVVAPPAHCGYWFPSVGTVAQVTFASVAVGESKGATMKVLATMPGVFHIRMAASGGSGGESRRAVVDLQTVVEPK